MHFLRVYRQCDTKVNWKKNKNKSRLILLVGDWKHPNYLAIHNTVVVIVIVDILKSRCLFSQLVSAVCDQLWLSGGWVHVMMSQFAHRHTLLFTLNTQPNLHTHIHTHTGTEKVSLPVIIRSVHTPDQLNLTFVLDLKQQWQWWNSESVRKVEIKSTTGFRWRPALD